MNCSGHCRFNAFPSKAVKLKICMAGLLTRSLTDAFPDLTPVAIGLMSVKQNRTYSSGTVQDLHLIPF